ASPEEEEDRGRRRKLFLLLFLLLILLLLSLLTAWYLLFRKPIELPAVTAPQAMPTYQGALYGMSRPKDVAVSADATRIVITQTGSSYDTLVMDRLGHKLGVLAPPANVVPSPHQMFVALDPATGEFWTTDRYNGIVAVYSGAGKFEKLFDPGTALDNWQPLGIAFDKTGVAYIADVSNGAAVIHVFGPAGQELRSFGAGQNLSNPNGLTVADDGTVYLADSGNGRLVVFDKTGNQVGTVGRGASEGMLGLPIGVALDDHANVLIVDSTAARVQAYAQLATGQSSPDYINAFGEKGSGDANFSFPNGIATDSQGRVYVADWGNDRLEIWSY
ncbi:MAG TPA: NHL repeat-containing protein, partial [Mycobacterium sp.]|nr:NHL repeat-containing protein [Mycobacterium sp.]